MSWRRKRARALAAGALAASAPLSGPLEANDQPSAASQGTLSPAQAAAEPQRPFALGAGYWSLTEGFSRSNTKGDVYLTQIHFNRYLRDDLAFLLGGTIGYADAKRAEGGVFGGPEIGLRWHFAQNESWSVYLDGTVGAVFHEEALTPDSLRFNFDLQLGIGVTYRLTSRTMILGGVRSFHLSNARIQGRDENLGYDAPMGYIGLMTSF